jgi:activator of HSP90 ATPase
MARSSNTETLEVRVNPTPYAAVPSRRRALSTIAATIAAAALPRVQAQEPSAQEPSAQASSMVEKPSTAAHRSLTAIHYEIDFHCSPQRLYEAILDQKQFATFSGMAATIDATPGGAFSQFGGLIFGRNVELVPNQRIVQAWRPSHWDAGIYSIVHFELKARAAETTLVFDHTGFPTGDYDHLDWGWHNHYWNPLKKLFA